MEKTGERQIGLVKNDIREDHRKRYDFVQGQLTGNEKVLDAGCGVGYGTKIISKVSKKVIGVDIDPETISYARTHWGGENIEFATEDLLFIDKTIKEKLDVVVAFEVIEHLLEPRMFLVKCKTLLKKDGVIYLSAPNQNKFPFSVEKNPFHLRHYKPEDLKELLSECGFATENLYSQCSSEVMDGSSGDFIIIKAKNCAEIGSRPLQSTLSAEGLKKSTHFIHDRAMLVVKLQKTNTSLKGQVEKLINMNKEKDRALYKDLLLGEIREINKVLASHEDLDIAKKLEIMREDLSAMRVRTVEAEAVLERENNKNNELMAENDELKLKARQHEAQRQILEIEKMSALQKANTSLKGQVEILKNVIKEKDRALHKDLLLGEIREINKKFAFQEDLDIAKKLEIMGEDLSAMRVGTMEAEAVLEREKNRNNELMAEYNALKLKASQHEAQQQILEIEKMSALQEAIDAKAELSSVRKTNYNLIEAVDAKTRELNSALLQVSEKDKLSQKLTEARKIIKENEQKLVAYEKEGEEKSKRVSSLKDEVNKLKLKTASLSAQNKALLEANQSLILEIEINTSCGGNIKGVEKEPPSLGYLLRKLKFHRCYIPFLYKSVRNSLGLNAKRKTMKSRR